MKILISSHRFAPSIGGIETVGRILAEEFSEAGHHVCVVTETPCAQEGDALFKVLRRPSPLELLRAVEWSDLYLHNNISLRAAWPLLMTSRPLVALHHTWIRRPNGMLGWRDRLKLRVLKHAINVAISDAVAASLPFPTRTLPDPYDSSMFQLQSDAVRARALIFVGRLVSDKGADLAIEALAALSPLLGAPELTIVGEGPERAALERLAAERGVGERVRFLGARHGTELCGLLNQHRIMVVPSRWNEPFGLVALEGIACGCVVVGSRGGGLEEAIGPCGLAVPNNDLAALVEALEKVLSLPGDLHRFQERTHQHLSRYRRENVARAYERLLGQTLEEWRGKAPLNLPTLASMRRPG